MDTNQNTNHSVVQPMSMPKMKIPSEKAASINAFALSFAAFFGFVAIFAAIASFTKGDWLFDIPLIGIVLANVGFMGASLITALLAVAFALIGLKTLKKVTDKKDLVKPWQCVAKVFLVLGVVYVVSMIAIALYSLLGVGDKSGVSQKNLWLSNFIPNLITAIAAIGIAFLAKQIAAGKTAILRTFSYIAIGVACVGFILVIVSTLVNFYSGKKSSTYDSGYDYGNSLNDLYDSFKDFSW